MKATLTPTQDNQTIITDLTQLKDFDKLNNSLQALKPNNSETTQVITYALMATAVVGIFVYQYLKSQESFSETSQS